MSIRPYQPQDGEAVLELWQRSATIAHNFLPAEHVAQERLAIATQYLPIAETWVYEHQGQIIGFVSLLNEAGDDQGGSEVGGLFVDPDWQGQGVGRALVDQAVALKGTLTVAVFEQNASGRRFYARYGFGEIGRSHHHDTGMPLRHLRYPRPRSEGSGHGGSWTARLQFLCGSWWQGLRRRIQNPFSLGDGTPPSGPFLSWRHRFLQRRTRILSVVILERYLVAITCPL